MQPAEPTAEPAVPDIVLLRAAAGKVVQMLTATAHADLDLLRRVWEEADETDSALMANLPVLLSAAVNLMVAMVRRIAVCVGESLDETVRSLALWVSSDSFLPSGDSASDTIVDPETGDVYRVAGEEEG